MQLRQQQHIACMTAVAAEGRVHFSGELQSAVMMQSAASLGLSLLLCAWLLCAWLLCHVCIAACYRWHSTAACYRWHSTAACYWCHGTVRPSLSIRGCSQSEVAASSGTTHVPALGNATSFNSRIPNDGAVPCVYT